MGEFLARSLLDLAKAAIDTNELARSKDFYYELRFLIDEELYEYRVVERGLKLIATDCYSIVRIDRPESDHGALLHLWIRNWVFNPDVRSHSVLPVLVQIDFRNSRKYSLSISIGLCDPSGNLRYPCTDPFRGEKDDFPVESDEWCIVRRYEWQVD